LFLKKTAYYYRYTQFKKTNNLPTVFRFAAKARRDFRHGLAASGRAYSSSSRQISTETSSTLSGIGGSGLVAFTHTPSSS
jgi:hypothetical protein